MHSLQLSFTLNLNIPHIILTLIKILILIHAVTRILKL